MRVLTFRPWVLVAVAACLSSVGRSQNSPYPDGPPAVLARLERLQRHDDVCALVNRTGEYRLERRYAVKLEVFVGTLTPPQLQEFEQLLNAADLKGISRSNVPHPMIVDTVDQFLFDVYRLDGEQHLNFNSPDARKPFRAGLDPLLKWLDKIQKAEHKQLAESNSSHCMPAPVNAGPVPATEPPPPRVPYVMAMATDHYRGGNVERHCVVVFPDGHYRREKSSQEYGAKIRLEAAEGSLNGPQIEQLRALVDAAELRDMKHETYRKAWVLEGDITVLAVPRQATVQRLRFAHYFQVKGEMDKPGAYSGLQYGLDPDEHVLNPVRDWLKINVEKQKLVAQPDSMPTNCDPER